MLLLKNIFDKIPVLCIRLFYTSLYILCFISSRHLDTLTYIHIHLHTFTDQLHLHTIIDQIICIHLQIS